MKDHVVLKILVREETLVPCGEPRVIGEVGEALPM